MQKFFIGLMAFFATNPALSITLPTVNTVTKYIQDYCGNEKIELKNVNQNGILTERYFLSVIDELNNDSTSYQNDGNHLYDCFKRLCFK